MVAHINPQEAMLLKAAGGRGSINPRTGLPEFLYGGGTSEGGATGGPTGGGNSNSPGGGGGRSLGGNENSAAGTVNSGTAGRNAAYGGGPALGGGRGSMGNDTVATHNQAAALGMTPDHYIGGASNLGQAVTDSYGSNFGRQLAGLFGFNKNTVNQPFGAYANGLNTAGWGFDPAGLVGSAIGTAVGAPFGVGLLADRLSERFGRPGQIALSGPNSGMGTGPHGSGLPGSGGGLFGGSSGSPGSAPGGGSNGPGGRDTMASNGGPAMGASPAMAAGTMTAATAPATFQNYLAGLRNGTIPPGTTIQAWAAAQQQGPGTTPTPTPGTPGAPGTPASTGPGLAPLMSQGSPNLIGNAYGGIPSWAMNPYQIGMAPTSYPVPHF